MSEPTIPFERLVALVNGELSAAEAAALEDTLAASEADRTLVEQMRAVIDALGREDASPEAVRRAGRLLREASERAATWMERFDYAWHTVAERIFDSRARAALAGYRGGGATVLAYEWAEGRVDLRISTADPGGRSRLQGQVTATHAGATARLLPSKGDADVAAETIDEHGRFRFEVSNGTFDLLIETADGAGAIVAPHVSVG